MGFILKSAAPSAAIAFCFENLESFEKVLDYFAMASVRLHSLCIKSPRGGPTKALPVTAFHNKSLCTVLQIEGAGHSISNVL